MHELSFLCEHTTPYIHPHYHSSRQLLDPAHQMHFPGTTYHYVLRLARRDGVNTRQTRPTVRLTVSSSRVVRNPCWRPFSCSVSSSVGRPEEDEGRYVTVLCSLFSMNDTGRREQRSRDAHRAYIILMKRTLIHAHVEPSEGDRYRFIMLRGKPHWPVGGLALVLGRLSCSSPLVGVRLFSAQPNALWVYIHPCCFLRMMMLYLFCLDNGWATIKMVKLF